MNRIALIGYMGSGKSSVGKELSALLEVSYVDLDVYIEELEQRSITTIFKESGEVYFRELERKAMKLVSKEDFSIVSFGGGTPCHYDNMEWINTHYYSIYLSASVEVLVQRLQGQKDSRPLLSNKIALDNYIRNHLHVRNKFYQQAHWIIDTSQLTIQQVSKLIFNKIKKLND